ncbi:MAG: DUF4399 domain-containing protein [Marinobacter sp.]|nr:DUF4399 domain-containing protein [Marinobacter sp.]
MISRTQRFLLSSVLAASLVGGAHAATPSDEHHRHFGGGQTQTSLELSPGQHTLQLLVGDHQHVPHEPPVMSEKITITVE